MHQQHVGCRPLRLLRRGTWLGVSAPPALFVHIYSRRVEQLYSVLLVLHISTQLPFAMMNFEDVEERDGTCVDERHWELAQD